MEGEQGAVAEGADELEVLRPRFGVFPNTADLAILATGGTENNPASEIRNVSVDGYRHAFIIRPLALADLGSLSSARTLLTPPIRLSFSFVWPNLLQQLGSGPSHKVSPRR